MSRWLIVAGICVGASTMAAQSTDSTRQPLRPMRGRGVALPNGRGPGQPGGRPELESQVRQAFAVSVRRQLSLDDEKMRLLQQTDAKFEAERRTLTREEAMARRTLLDAIQDSTATDQSKIEQAMSHMLQIQRRRVDLLEAEQKGLSAFLTPRQRAQYFALRERMMRRVLELQQGRGMAPGGRRGGPPPA